MKATSLVAIAFMLLVIVQPVQSKSSYCSRFPNGATVDFDTCALFGHTTKIGRNGENSFGVAFANAGRKWTTSLCQADSDGDGQTNGQELGDSCCLWTTSNGLVQFSSGVSNPGSASAKVDDSLLKSINCSKLTTVATPAPTTSQPVSPLPGVTTAAPTPTTTSKAK